MDAADEGEALMEERAGEVDFKFEQGAEGGGGDALGEIGVGDAEAAHVGLRDVDAVLLPVDADVLPEVGELEGGAGRIA